MKKILLTILFVLLALLAVVGLILTLGGRDIPPPDLSDLAVVRPTVAPEDNAYVSFRAMTNLIVRPEDNSSIEKVLSGTAALDEPLLDLIRRNEPAFEQLRACLTRDVFLPPEIRTFEDNFWSQADLYIIGRLLVLKAMAEQEAGRQDPAIAAIGDQLRLVDLAQKGSECLITWHVGVRMLDEGLAQVRNMALDSAVSAEQLARMADTLTQLGPVEPGLIGAIKGDYQPAFNAVDAEVGGKDMMGLTEWDARKAWMRGILVTLRRLGYSFHPNKTKLMIADGCRYALANVGRSYNAIAPHTQEPVTGFLSRKVPTVFQPNGMGQVLYLCTIRADVADARHACTINCALAATRLVVACLRYELKEGRRPAELAALVPDYLDAVPADPYDGQPFRYLPEQGLLYAVGPDLRDGGGSRLTSPTNENLPPSRRRWKADDIVFDLAPPAREEP